MSSLVSRLVLTVVGCLALTTAAKGHELCLKAEKREGRLCVEAWFDNDTPADGVKVKVLQDGRTVVEGNTDERGVWTADCPAAGTYRIQATDGGGHKAEVEFVLDESNDTQRAGATKEEVSARRVTGAVLGLAVVAALILAGRWLLRRSS